MSSYSILRRGDNLPTVAVLQKLLNRTGASLKVDGSFGRKTHYAVVEFQRARGMTSDGVIEGQEWSRLKHLEVLPLVDCIDVFDEKILQQQAQSVIDSGGHPLLVGGMSNGLGQVATSLQSARYIYLLRFIGHGCPGVQGVSIGKGGWIEHRGPGQKPIRHIFGEENSRLHYKNAPSAGALKLQKIFGPYTSVELHGCHVAAGRLGHLFIHELAAALGVPVTAGVRSQRSALRFDGPTFTAYPRGVSPASWCASLPDFTGSTVP